MSFGGDVSLRSRGGGGGAGGGGGSSYTVASMPNYADTSLHQTDPSAGGQQQPPHSMTMQPNMQIAYQANSGGTVYSGMQSQQMQQQQQQQPPYLQTAPPMAMPVQQTQQTQQLQQQQPGMPRVGYSSGGIGGGGGVGVSLQGAFPQAPMPSQSSSAMPVQQFYQPVAQAQSAFPQAHMHAADATVYNLDDAAAEGGQPAMRSAHCAHQQARWT